MAGDEFFVGPDDNPDKYRLKVQVGSGGEAQLWRAEIDVAGQRETVAVKVLRAEHGRNLDRWKGRWAEQAEVLHFIRHPGVVGVREHFEGGGFHHAGEQAGPTRALYLTMNWVEGMALREWATLHRSPADQYEALRHLSQVADVLDHLHSGQATTSGRPVIHADVTPNNVIVTPAGQAVLVDFGLTRLAGGISPVVEGTEGFVAPEVREKGAYSIASDRYAFGALAYWVLTGTTPPADAAAVRAGLSAVPAVAAQPAALDRLMSMFDPDPGSRPNCVSWLRELRATGATSVETTLFPTAPMAPGSAPVPGPPPGVVPPAPKRRSRAALVAFAGVLVAAIVIGALALSGRGDDAGKASSAATTAASTTLATTAAATTAAAATTTTAAPPATTTTVAATTTTTVAPTTTTRVATTSAPSSTLTPTSTPSLKQPLAATAYTFGLGCLWGNVQVRTEVRAAAHCGYQDAGFVKSEFSLDVNVTPRTKQFTARVVLADLTLPVENTAFVRVLVDGTAVTQGVVSFAAPFELDLDVTDKSRVTFRFTIPEESRPSFQRLWVALVDAFFAT